MKRVSSEMVMEAGDDLGECPVWDNAERRLWWTDIHGRRIGSADASPKPAPKYIPVSSRVGALGLRKSGGLLVGLEDRFAFLDSDLATLSPIAALNDPAPATRLNDGRVDPFGSFVCGSMVEAGGTPNSANLYRLHPDGDVEVLIPDITCANSTCWSPDGDWLYFSDMPTGRVDRRRYRGRSEPLGEPEPFIQLDPAEGLPDGAVTDEDGGLWLAVWGGGKVLRFAADGRRTHEVQVPTTNPTCPAFGGNGLRTLYITTARFGLTEAQRTAEPLAGHVFACEPGIGGHPEQRFKA